MNFQTCLFFNCCRRTVRKQNQYLITVLWGGVFFLLLLLLLYIIKSVFRLRAPAFLTFYTLTNGNAWDVHAVAHVLLPATRLDVFFITPHTPRRKFWIFNR